MRAALPETPAASTDAPPPAPPSPFAPLQVGGAGPLESIRINHERGEALVAFVSAYDAGALLASKASVKLHDQTAELSWGKAKPIPPELADAISAGATRNLQLVPLPAATELAALNAVFSQFGPIESIRVLRQTASLRAAPCGTRWSFP